MHPAAGAPRIDMHTHSAASDGTDSPEALIAAAVAAGLTVIALTDHDTTAGWAGAAAVLPPGLILVPGAEVSCMVIDRDRRVSVHLLAYLFDRAEPVFAAARARLRTERLDRGRRIVAALSDGGVPIGWDDIHALAGGAPIGRPHIARALVAAGAAGTVQEAFTTLLHPTSPYYRRKQDLEATEAVRLVRAAGGVSVFAHPRARRRGRVVSDDVIHELADAGLGGLEVDHTDHDDEDRAQLRRLAAQLGLVTTGSSDYHGTNKTVRLGAETTAPWAYEAICAQGTGAQVITA